MSETASASDGGQEERDVVEEGGGALGLEQLLVARPEARGGQQAVGAHERSTHGAQRRVQQHRH